MDKVQYYTLGLCTVVTLMETMRSGFAVDKTSNGKMTIGDYLVASLSTIFILCIEAIIFLPILGRIFEIW